MPVGSPKNIQLSCVEMSRQSLAYGGHTSNETWVLTLQHPGGVSTSVYPLPRAAGETYPVYQNGGSAASSAAIAPDGLRRLGAYRLF